MVRKNILFGSVGTIPARYRYSSSKGKEFSFLPPGTKAWLAEQKAKRSVVVRYNLFE